ncbi:MAG: peptide ABC transporter substrate-binding protein [Gemmatimonadaceae bacterium]
MRSTISFALSLLTIAAVACSDRTVTPAKTSASPHGGTLVISAGGDPDLLLPPLTVTSTGRLVNALIYDHLAEIGDSLNTAGDKGFEPRLARSWEWSPDSLSIAFALDPRARWHDGIPVRASDVRFTHRIYAAASTGSPFAAVISSIDSVSVRDSLTAVFWFSRRSPLQFFDAVYPMSILPEHALGGVTGEALRTSGVARAPIGSGRFRFVRWRAGSSVELAADTGNYRERPNLNRVIVTIAPDFNTALARVLGGEADLLEQIPITSLPQVIANPDLRAIPAAGLEYNFIQFNLRAPASKSRLHPLFGDSQVRRALTMAVDRKRTVQNVYDTLAYPAVGPTVRAFPTTDTALRQIEHSPDGARRILDSLGWRDRDRDGIREKNGRPLRFTLGVPSSSKARVSMAVLVQEQLRQVGARLDIDQLEFSAFMDRQTRRDFDAVFGSWLSEASPGGIRQTWGTQGSRKTGGSNYGSYENTFFDAHVDSGLAALSFDTRKSEFTAAYQRIIDDAPAIWMAEPRRLVVLHRRIQSTTLRADAWWAHIDEWSVPANSRIARDQAPAPR